jgi:hypothetical protein
MHKLERRGDTIIEVMISITLFSLVSISTISIMNSGLSTTESSLETTMARSEIDAQAETIRYIHNSYVAEYERLPSEQRFRDAWGKIIENAIDSSELFSLAAVSSCPDVYDRDRSGNIYDNGAFIVNTRRLAENLDDANPILPDSVISALDNSYSNDVFAVSSLYPRLIFSDVDPRVGASPNDSDEALNEELGYAYVTRAEGIWVTAVKGDVSEETTDAGGNTLGGIPKYYDFYIRTCWVAPGRSYPTKLSTIVRLYNPANESGDLVNEV